VLGVFHLFDDVALISMFVRDLRAELRHLSLTIHVNAAQALHLGLVKAHLKPACFRRERSLGFFALPRCGDFAQALVAGSVELLLIT